MKEQVIAKINKIGKISMVAAIICKILLIAAFSICLLGLIVCLILPKDIIKVTSADTSQMEIDYNAIIGKYGSEEDLAQFQEMENCMAQGGDVQVTSVQSGMRIDGLNVGFDGQTYTPTTISVEDGVVKMDMVSDEVSAGIRDVVLLMALALVYLAMTIITMTFIEKLCKAFRDCQSPFEENVIRRMQKLAYVLIPWTLLSSVSESLLNSAVYNNMQWSISIDLGMVLVVLIVLILVYIFKYGAVLQQESDETL